MSDFIAGPSGLIRVEVPEYRQDGRQFTPSNGTEGMDFMAQFCDRCSRENEAKEIRCPILTASMMGEGPAEWVYQNEQPLCTKFLSREDAAKKAWETRRKREAKKHEDQGLLEF